MGNNTHLHEYIGKVFQAVPPDAYATDFAVSSNYEVPIDGHKGCLFILNMGAMSAGTVDGAIYYASNGVASDAGVDTDVWSASNAVWAQITSDSSAGVYLLNVDLGAKNLSGGSLYVKLDVVGQPDVGVVAIPYGGNVSLPATNAQTVVNAT